MKGRTPLKISEQIKLIWQKSRTPAIIFLTTAFAFGIIVGNYAI